MGQARDEAGNVWETDAQGNPVRLVRAAQQQPPQADPTFPTKGPRSQADLEGQRLENRIKEANLRKLLAEEGGGNVPGDTSKTGDDYLASLPAPLAAQVKALSEGRRAFPTGAALRSPDVQALVAAATQYDPTLDAANAATRVATRKDFTSGVSARNVTAMNTALGHLGTLRTAARGLENRSFPLWNTLANAAETATGDPRVKNFTLARNAVSNELMKVFRGTGGSLTEIEEWQNNIDSSDSPEQLDATVKQAVELLNSRIESMSQQYSRGMGRSSDVMELLSPHAREVYDRISSGKEDDGPPVIGLGTANGGNTPGGGPPADPNLLMAGDAYRQDSPVPEQGSVGNWLAPKTREVPDYEAAARISQMVRQGMSGDEINAALGYNAVSEREVSNMQNYLQSPAGKRDRRSIIANPPMRTEENSTMNRISGGGPGAAAMGYTNAATFGAGDMIDPRAMAATRDAHPIMEGLGEIGGVLANAKGMGMVGGALGKRLAPQMADKFIGMAPAARNLISDTIYGTTRGGMTGDPVGGFLAGAGGSVAGQALGSAVGRGFSGVRSSPTITRLRDQGVVPTLGQIMRGRAADNGGMSAVAGIEDAFANTPGLGALVNTARGRALEQGNTAGYRAAAEGAPIEGVGNEALLQLGKVRNTAYDDALQGVSLPLHEPKFLQQIGDIDGGRGASEFDSFMGNNVRKAVGNGPEIGGRRLQETLRMLKTNRNQYQGAAAGNPHYGDVADAIGQVDDAFLGNAARNAPQAIPKLKKANRINRNTEILDRAAGMEGAVNNGGVWTGAQLGSSLGADAARFSGGRGLTKRAQAPLFQLQQDMQAVLPNKVAPTGVNAAPMLALGGLAAGGANEASGFESDTLRLASMLALTSSPYTRWGQSVVAKALLARPQSARTFGSAIRKRKGLFGSAAVPLALEAQQ